MLDLHSSILKNSDAQTRGERDFYNLLLQMPTAVALLGLPGCTVLFANDCFLRLTGRTRSQIINQPIFQTLSVHEGELVRLVSAVQSSGRPFTLTERRISLEKNGRPQTAWFNAVFQPVQDGNGDADRMMVVVTDVTEAVELRLKKEAEETLLRKTGDQLALSISVGQIGIWHWDSITDTVTWSKEQLAIYGVTESGFSGRIEDFHRFVLPEDLPLVTRTSAGEKKAEGDYEYRFRIRRSDGEVRWIQGRSRSFHNAAGELEYRIGVNVDITERKRAEDALQQSEEKFRSTFDNAAVGIAHVNIDGHWQMVNDRLCGIVGYTREELLTTSFQDITHPDDLEKDLKFLQEVLQRKRTSYAIEKRYFRKDGNMVWVNLTVSLVRNAKGHPKYFISVVEDITERKAADQKLSESETRFRTLAETLPQLVWMMDVKGKIVYASKQWQEYSGIEDVHEAWDTMVHPDDRKGLVGAWDEAFAAGVSFRHEVRLQDRDGEYRWHFSEAEPLADEAGRVGKWIGALTDIHEQKTFSEKLEQKVAERTAELERSQDFLQSVLYTTQNGIVTYDPIYGGDGKIIDFRIAFINHMVTKDLGLLPSEVMGKTVREVFPATFADGSFEHLVRFVETGEGSFREMSHPLNGDTLHLEVSLARMGAGATVTVMNVTEQKKAALQLEKLNAQLHEANAELQRSNEDLQQFAHVASHDLKEPIRKVRTFGSRMEEEYGDLLPEKAKMYLDKMQSSAERMAGLIDGVLNYSTINSMENLVETVDLNEVFFAIESDLEVALQEKGGRICKHDLPAVKGSMVLLNQLFYNLLNNALKFSKPGVPPAVTIAAETVTGRDFMAFAEIGSEETFVQISVCDNGIGFKPEQAGKIFKTFTRLNSRDKYEGTGLGLALCKKIAERHGGHIYATGREGEGACFYVLLPR